jgi:hypothetical protein
MYALNEPGDLGGMYKRALSIRQNTLGVDDLLVAQAMHGLARFHARSGSYGDAEKLYKQALSIIRWRRSIRSKASSRIPTR